MKIQLTLNDDVGKKIKENAKAIGVSVSAYCGVLLGTQINATERMMEEGKKVINDSVKNETLNV